MGKKQISFGLPDSYKENFEFIRQAYPTYRALKDNMIVKLAVYEMTCRALEILKKEGKISNEVGPIFKRLTRIVNPSRKFSALDKKNTRHPRTKIKSNTYKQSYGGVFGVS